MTHIAQRVAETNIKAFINRDPTVVSIQSRKTTMTASGGKKWVNDGEPFNETVRFVPATTTTEKQTTRITADGRTVLPNWMVVTMPETDIAIGAILTAGTDKYEVVHRSPVPSWRVTFEAIQDGV